ncbi:MAG: M23 family metallopeptidase [Bacteroidetes bacterium]|nr:M23 family metallopeptidase [Bacteroidota bacterium]
MKILFIIFSIIPWLIHSQIKYPTSDFSNPLEIPLILNGNFGESRSNHFHSGIDIKTQLKEGLKVFSVAKGNISRIKIDHGGFGKAIYVNHPNGYTTVYAHLKKFNSSIEEFVKRIQYKKQSYEIDFYLNSSDLKVFDNEIIGFSGNTGSSSGPHLHFETRKTINQKALNPLLFGIEIKDTKRPVVNSLYMYKKLKSGLTSQPYEVLLNKINDSTFTTKKIKVNGLVSFGLSGFDSQDLAKNKNGIYEISTFLNDTLINSIKFDSFFFEESIKINSLIDYSFYIKNKKRILKLFLEEENDLSIYSTKNNGFIDVKQRAELLFKIVASDIKGNSISINVPLDFENIAKTTLTNSQEISYSKKIDNSLENNFKFKNSHVNIPRNTFLKNRKLKIEHPNDTLKIINPYVPLYKNINIKFKNTNNTKGNYLAVKGHDNKESFASSKLNPLNYFELKTKKLGLYFIKNDSVFPTIRPLNFKNEDWISNKKYLKFKIVDKESGIKKYKGKINGKWMLFEYEYKKNLISYEFDSYYLSKSKNEVEIEVEDMVGNTLIKTFTFYRN